MKYFPVIITHGHSRAARRVLLLIEELHSNRIPSASRVCGECMLYVRERGTGDTEDGDGDRDHTTSVGQEEAAQIVSENGLSDHAARSIGMASRFGLRPPMRMRCRRHYGRTRRPLTCQGDPCDRQCG